jgi:hypothetical protein
MALPNIFESIVATKVIDRINKLSNSTAALWGKMDVAAMLAHCCVTYEMMYEDKHPKPNAVVKFILKMLVKKGVVNEVPYKKNSGTAPAFIIKSKRDFDTEKNRLIAYINKTVQLGSASFDGKISDSFGPLTILEWNNLMYKHLDHHLCQFGV